MWTSANQPYFVKQLIAQITCRHSLDVTWHVWDDCEAEVSFCCDKQVLYVIAWLVRAPAIQSVFHSCFHSCVFTELSNFLSQTLSFTTKRLKSLRRAEVIGGTSWRVKIYYCYRKKGSEDKSGTVGYWAEINVPAVTCCIFYFETFFLFFFSLGNCLLLVLCLITSLDVCVLVLLSDQHFVCPCVLSPVCRFWGSSASVLRCSSCSLYPGLSYFPHFSSSTAMFPLVSPYL